MVASQLLRQFVRRKDATSQGHGLDAGSDAIASFCVSCTKIPLPHSKQAR